MMDQATIKFRYQKENDLEDLFLPRIKDWQNHAEGKVPFETVP